MKIIKNDRLLKQILQEKEYERYFGHQIDEHVFLADFSAGETIIYQDEKPDYLYYLIKGKCRVSAFMENGKTVIINTLTAPCLVGEIEIIKNDSPFSVETMQNCRAVVIPVNRCRNILLNDNRFLYQLCVSLVDKERNNAINLAHHISFPFEYRLAKFILDNSDGKTFKLKKTIIAESLGISYRHLEKVMNSFIAKGYLKKEKLTYYITDRNALDKLADSLTIFYKS